MNTMVSCTTQGKRLQLQMAVTLGMLVYKVVDLISIVYVYYM